MLLYYNNNHIKTLPKIRCVNASEQNALSRRVSGGGGGGTERNRRRVDGSTWLRIGASSTGGGGWRRFRRLSAIPLDFTNA